MKNIDQSLTSELPLKINSLVIFSKTTGYFELRSKGNLFRIVCRIVLRSFPTQNPLWVLEKVISVFDSVSQGKERFHVRHLVFRVVFPYCRCLLAFYQLCRRSDRRIDPLLRSVSCVVWFIFCVFKSNPAYYDPCTFSYQNTIVHFRMSEYIRVSCRIRPKESSKVNGGAIKVRFHRTRSTKCLLSIISRPVFCSNPNFSFSRSTANKSKLDSRTRAIILSWTTSSNPPHHRWSINLFYCLIAIFSVLFHL